MTLFRRPRCKIQDWNDSIGNWRLSLNVWKKSEVAITLVQEKYQLHYQTFQSFCWLKPIPFGRRMFDVFNIWNNEPHSFNCFIYLWLIFFPALAGQNTCLNRLSNNNSSGVFFSPLSQKTFLVFNQEKNNLEKKIESG